MTLIKTYRKTLMTNPIANKTSSIGSRLRYSYLIATSYSGSTLLSMLLDTHPEIVSIGELANEVWKPGRTTKYYCSCGSEISQCKFWIDVKERCAGRGMELDLYDFDLKLDLGWGRLANKLAFGVAAHYGRLRSVLDILTDHVPAKNMKVNFVADRTTALVHAILEASGKTHFFDTSKEIRRAMYLSADGRMHTRVIHLVRDPRAVLHSFLRRKRSTRVNQVLNFWMRTHTNALRLKSRIAPSDYLLVHYEELCRAPEETLDLVCQFLGVQPYPIVSEVNDHVHHVIGNEMRNQRVRSIECDDEWRTDLPQPLNAKCKQRTAGLAAELGYSF